jgi:polyhydroxyalkanoate synthesis regulator phasin
MARETKKAMPDAWRTYLELAVGVTDASRKRATKAAKDLMGKTGATADQIQTFAEDLYNSSAANREAMVKLVRFELDRALGRVGLATADEVAELTNRVRQLEGQLRRAQGGAAAESGPDGSHGAGTGAAASAMVKAGRPTKTTGKTARKAAAKKAVAKKASKKAIAAAGGGRTTAKAPARKAMTKKAVAKKAAKSAGGTA